MIEEKEFMDMMEKAFVEIAPIDDDDIDDRVIMIAIRESRIPHNILELIKKYMIGEAKN